MAEFIHTTDIVSLRLSNVEGLDIWQFDHEPFGMTLRFVHNGKSQRRQVRIDPRYGYLYVWFNKTRILFSSEAEHYIRNMRELL